MKTEGALIEALVEDLRPVARLGPVTGRLLRWSALALVCVGAGVAALGVRRDVLEKLHDPAFLIEGGVLLLGGLLWGLSAFRLDVPGRRAARWLPLVALGAWSTLVASRYSAAGSGPGGLCVWRMVGLGLAPGAGLLLMLRQGAPLERGWTGLCALLSAGSLAMLGTQFLCARDGAWHILVWHLAPLVAVGVMGVGLGWMVLGGRRS